MKHAPATQRGAETHASLATLLHTASLHHQAGKWSEAEALYRGILAKDPAQPDALNLLGVLAHQTGHNDDAVELIGRAVLANPANPKYYINLANVLMARGDPDSAIEMYQRALAINPADADAHNNLGNVLKDLGRLDESAGHYRKALDLRPDFVEAHRNRGILLQERGQTGEAIEHYQRAVTLRPDFAPAHNSLGNARRETGDTDAAMQAYRRALELNPKDADTHAGLAVLHIDLGHFDAAQQELNQTFAVSPEHPLAWATLPATRKMTEADNAWLNTAQQLLTRPQPRLLPLEAVKLHYAVGKYYDDTRQYDLAFAAYREANALKRRIEGGFDLPGLTALVDTLIRTYSAETLHHARSGASASPRPVLIIGMPRSGTSLTEQIIASHPQAFGAGELFYWGHQIRAHQPMLIEHAPDASLLATLAGGYEQQLHGLAPDALRVVDKMPNNFFWAGLIHLAFPQAHIIHTRRHPVDTCLSIYFQNFKSSHSYGTDLEELVHYYREYQRLMHHWRSVLPPDRFLEIDYEALVEDQEGGSRKIIEFLGLPWDDRCLAFHETERKVGTASNWQVRQKIYKTSKERWRRYEKHIGPLRQLLDSCP